MRAALVALIVAVACTQPVAQRAPRSSDASPPDSNAQKARGPMAIVMREYALGAGQGPHDVAPAADGGVWYTAQRTGELGWLDPKTGATKMVRLGSGSAPHGVVVGPDGAAWVTDGGLNAIVRVDPATGAVTRFDLPRDRPNANLNTATFDPDGTLWFTGQNGVLGRLDPRSGAMAVFDAPRGPGPYGIATCPDGAVYYASLAGSFVGLVARQTGATTVLQPPTIAQGSRRVWCDSRSRVWVSEWNAGKLARYDPADRSWREYPLATASQPYAVYVGDNDVVWVSDFAQNAILDFDIASGTWHANLIPTRDAAVRQLLGRPGEVWGAESGADKLLVIRIGA